MALKFLPAAAIATTAFSFAVLTASPTLAAVNLVANGSFESTTLTASGQLTSTNLTGWSSSGLNFLFFPQASTISGTSADNSGAAGQYGQFYLAGPGQGVSNGLINSPDGGKFIGADADSQFSGAITQTITGLTAGASYFLTFNWAGAQQYNYNSSTVESWQVKFGGQTLSTPQVTTAANGFTGWKTASMFFTVAANTTVQTLSFLAVGGPNGAPPFALLDGISLVAAPEPATWTVLLVGMGGLAVLTCYRRRNQSGNVRHDSTTAV